MLLCEATQRGLRPLPGNKKEYMLNNKTWLNMEIYGP